MCGLGDTAQLIICGQTITLGLCWLSMKPSPHIQGTATLSWLILNKCTCSNLFSVLLKCILTVLCSPVKGLYQAWTTIAMKTGHKFHRHITIKQMNKVYECIVAYSNPTQDKMMKFILRISRPRSQRPQSCQGFQSILTYQYNALSLLCTNLFLPKCPSVYKQDTSTIWYIISHHKQWNLYITKIFEATAK